MLDLASPPRSFDGVVLFPDHAVAGRWYVAGGRVRPTRPEALRLDLIRGGVAGGFLQLELTADPEPAAMEAAKATLGADAELVPVDWVHGEIWLAGRLGETDVGAQVGQPGTSGSSDAVVALRVGEELARALSASIQGDAAPAVVGVHLEAVGLAAPLDAEIEADMAAVYDAFAAQGALLTPIGRAKVVYLVEELERGGAIRVHVSDGAGDETRAAALQRFGEDLVRAAFTPAAITALSPTLDPAMAKTELQFKLSFRGESSQQHMRWSYRERAARRFSHFLSASLLGWVPDPTLAVREHTVEPDAGPLEIVAVGGFDWVTVEFDAPTSTSRTLLPDATRATLLLAAASRATLRYRVTTQLPPGRLAEDGPLRSDWIEAPGALALVIDPVVVHGLQVVTFELLTGESGCLGVDVRLTRPVGDASLTNETPAGVAPAAAEVHLSFDPTAPRAQRHFASSGWRMVRRWRYASDTIEDEAELSLEMNLLIPPTRTSQTRLLVVADEGLEAVDLVVVGEGPPTFRAERTLLPGESSVALELVLPRFGPERWTWTAAAIYTDGRARVETGGPSRVLVFGAPEGVRRIVIVLLASPEAQGFAAITLSLRAGESAAFTWLASAAMDAVLTLPASAPSSWSLLAEGLRVDGTRTSVSLSGDSDLLVLPSLTP